VIEQASLYISVGLYWDLAGHQDPLIAFHKVDPDYFFIKDRVYSLDDGASCFHPVKLLLPGPYDSASSDFASWPACPPKVCGEPSMCPLSLQPNAQEEVTITSADLSYNLGLSDYVSNTGLCSLFLDLVTVQEDSGNFVPLNSSYDGMFSFASPNIVISAPSDRGM